MAKNPFKKPKPGDTGLVADIYEGIDVVGDYLEPKIQTGIDYFKSLGSKADDVTRNVLVNKFNRQVDLSGAKSSTQKRGIKQQASRNKLLNEVNERRNKQLIKYLDEDPVFEDALMQADQLRNNIKQGKGYKYLEGYEDFLKNFSQIYKNKTLDKKSFDKFNILFQNLFFEGSRPAQLRKMEKSMVDLNLLKESDIMSAQDSVKILQDKGINMRGFTQGGQNPAHMYDFLREEIANVSKKYREDFIKKYGEEPLGRNFTRQGFFDYVKKESSFLNSYFDQIGLARGEGVDTSRDLRELRTLFDDAKIEYPDLIGEFDPGSISTLKSKRSSDYIADYEPGGVRWSDGTVVKKGSDLEKTIRGFKRDVLQFVPVGDNTLMVNTNLDNQISRMINKQVLQGVDPLKAANNVGKVLKNTDPKKMSSLSDLLNKKQKISDKIKLAREKGLTNNIIDDVSLAHVTDVADDYRLGLEIDNLFLAPLKANTKQYTFYDKALRELQGKLQSGVSTPGMSADITRQIDDVGKQLEAEGIVTDVGYGRVGKARSADDVTKMYDEQLDFYMAQPEDRLYTADMNKRIQEGAQGPAFAEGGEVVVDEETGMMDYLTDNPLYNNVIKPIEEARDAKTEEYDLENNPQRVLPVMVGEALELPGEAYNALPNWLEGNDAILKNLGNPNAPSVALAKAATGLMGMMTDPVARLTKNIGDPDRVTTIPYPTWEKKEDGQYHYKDMQTLELPSDNPIAIGIDTLKTAGLGAAEILLAFNPIKLVKLGANPNLAQKVGKFVVNDLAGPLIALTTAHKAADVLDSKQSEELNQAVDQMQKETDKLIDDMENVQDAAEFGESQDPGYGFNDGYANSGFAYGGEVTPGPFAESMQTGLEEEIDIQDLDLGPAYEGFDDLDIFEEAERGGNQPVEVALNLNKVVGEVPKWVKQGKERFKMAMDNLLPGRNTPDTGTDVAIVDDVVENVTPLTRSEPGQIFYHQMEAELERGPKVYNSSKEVYDFLNARGIGKVEVIDSEIKPMLEKLEGMGQPITREMLLGVVRESPIRNVKSGGYGFLSDTLDGEMRSLNYSGYKERGAIPNTDRERVLYVDPQDLRGDTGNLPSSMSPHSFSEPYVIAWSRLSDRELGGAFTGKTTTFADEIQSDIFQASQRVAGKLAAKMRHMADQGIPFDRIQNDLQRDMMQYFKDKGTVFRESMPSASALKVEYDKLVSLQNQLRELSKTPVPEITDEMLTAARGVEAQQTAILDNLVDKFNLDLNKQLYPNLPFKLRDQWADASIKRDIYEAAYRKFVLKDPNATDYYAITPANLVTKRYGQAGSTKTPQADRIADKKERLERWVRGGMEGDIPNSQYPGVGMYEFYGGPGTDVVTEGGKHFTSSMEKTLKRIAKENNVKVEVLPVKIGDDAKDVWNVVNKETGEILGTGDTARQADAIANDLLLQGMKIKVDRTKQFDTAPSFGVELTPSMAEAFKAYMASGGYVADEEIVGAYGD
jgi:hypothetical protein